MTTFPANLQEFDLVRITGTASSPHGRRFENLLGVVATISLRDDEDCPPAIKIWPVEDYGDDCKIWFWLRDIEELTILEDQ